LRHIANVPSFFMRLDGQVCPSGTLRDLQGCIKLFFFFFLQYPNINPRLFLFLEHSMD
jgi:hypothetical protein